MSSKRNTGPAHSSRPVTPTRQSAPVSKPPMVATQNRSPLHVIEQKPSEATRAQIEEAAYYLWLKRGGSDFENWIEAERLVKNSRSPLRSS